VLRSIALPIEHGGWGLTLEPVLLGLLVAQTPAGWLLGVFAVLVFLAHRPTRLVLVDLRRRRIVPRTRIAAAAAGAYLAVAAAALIAAALVAADPFWLALGAAVPLVLIEGWYEVRSRTRDLGRELSGPLAAGSIAAALALAAGWGVGAAAGLWTVLALRTVVSVMLVRAQIARAHARSYHIVPLVSVHVGAVLAGAAAAVAEFIPRLGAAAIAGLGLWAVIALRTPPVRAVIVGVTQTVAGLVVVLMTAAGHWTGW
jgi:hypothetical protein